MCQNAILLTPLSENRVFVISPLKLNISSKKGMYTQVFMVGGHVGAIKKCVKHQIN